MPELPGTIVSQLAPFVVGMGVWLLGLSIFREFKR